VPTNIAPDPSTFTELLREMSDTVPAAKDATSESYLDLRPVRQVNAGGFPSCCSQG
jgi:hypothetical protein